jgi:hypothetical protein
VRHGGSDGDNWPHPMAKGAPLNVYSHGVQEFRTFMWLVKSAVRGLPLPSAPLSQEQLQRFTSPPTNAEGLYLQVSRVICRRVQGAPSNRSRGPK